MSNNKKLAVLVLGAALALTRPALAETTGQFIDDSAITTKAKAALIADSNLHASDITVNTDHGVVKLTGYVNTPSEYALAAQDVNGVSGVKTVANMLTVRQSASQ